MDRFVLCAAAVCLFASPAAATTVDFDFFDQAKTQATSETVGIPLDAFTDFGFTLATDAPNGLSLYNSDCGGSGQPACSSNDSDLASGAPFGTPPQGRVLIAQDGGQEAGDLPGTYTFSFLFNRPVFLDAIEVMDLDESLSQISFTTVFADSSSQTFSDPFANVMLINPGFPNDNSLRKFTLGVDNVARLDVNFQNISGAISSVTYTPVPIPAGLPLIATALGLLGLFGRRSRKS